MRTFSSRAWFLTSLAWLVFAFLQAPGLTVADTKLDLTQNPWGFLRQALQPWTDVFPLGQLQNQAYGYLFPHGLFFALLSWLPDWVAQRLWWALLLILAFAGTIKLLDATRVGSRTSRVIAAVLFALSPRILTTLGAISSEAWVVALAPWVLYPLVTALSGRESTSKPSERESTPAPSGTPGNALRNAALRSAVAALCMGAVNVVATAVAILPAVLWWLAALANPRSRLAARRFGRWWVPAGIAACFWWIGPLLILGRYSPPFTDYIESSSLTTRWLNLLEVLRGTTSWVPFLSSERMAGAALVAEPVFIVATLAVAAVGLWGLSHRDLPFAGRWLLILGVGLAAFGFATSPFSWFAESARGFLDGAGAALRNLHKFDVLVRLPLVVGVAHALGRINVPRWDADGRDQWRHPEKYPAVAQMMAAGLLVVMVTAPGWSGRIAPTEGFRAVPGYWSEAAAWLNEHAAAPDDGRTMILPEARFGRQSWGNTRDEPAQPLLDVPWVVRDSVPLVQPGAIRALDGVQREVNSGLAIPTLAQSLQTQGVGHVLVRSDLIPAADTPGVTNVLRTLRESGGFHEVAKFGDDEPGSANDQVRIFAVDPDTAPESQSAPAGGLREVAADQVEIVHAGPEALPRLDAADRALGRTTGSRVRVLNQQLPEPGSPTDVFRDHGPQTLTDTPARRDHNYGNVTNADSEIRSPDERSQVLNPVRDYPVSDPVATAGQSAVATQRSRSALTEIHTEGGTIRASSSAADPTSFGGADTLSSVTSAVDGDPKTAWYPSAGRSLGEHLEFEFPTDYERLRLQFRSQGGDARIHVETFRRDRGDTVLGSTTVTATSKRETFVSMPGGRADRVRITLLGSFRDVGLAEVKVFAGHRGHDLQDVTPSRIPTLPTLPTDTAQFANRFVFGQEIPEHRMLRAFTVPEHLAGEELVVHTDDCTESEADEASTVTVDDSDYRCGDTLELSAGRHLLKSTSRWVALSAAEPLYAEAVQQATEPTAVPVVDPTATAPNQRDEAYELGYADSPRIVFLPGSANPGRTATLESDGHSPHSMRLHPITVNGWQQGWVVPAGMSGTVTIGFAATGFYQTWLTIGLVLAVGLVLAWLVSWWRGSRVLREDMGVTDWRPEKMGEKPRLASTILAAVGTVALTGIIAGPAGIITFVGVAGIATGITATRRVNLRGALGIVGGIGLGIAAIIAARQPWTSAHYAGDSWVVQLALVAVISAAYLAHLLPMATRAGSSTKE